MAEYKTMLGAEGLRGQEVVIIASGKSGEIGFPAIPPHQTTICCNYGIMWPGHCTYWMVSDGNCPKADWWDFAWQKGQKSTRVFSRQLEGYGHWIYDEGRPLSTRDPFPEDGVLRCNATVAGQALQFAYWQGAKTIYLVGVDMRGSEYFGGQASGYKRPGHWPHLNKLQALCNVIIATGVEILPLSPTALVLPSPARV